MRKCYSLLLALLFVAGTTTHLSAQKPTPFEQRLNGFDQRKSLQSGSILPSAAPVSIGPSVFSCRVTDVDVNPANPAEMYVAYASGGLWHTTNHGTTFEPVFDHEASMTIGDIAVDWSRRIIWVGTGECNSSRSSYAGTGIYRSADGGKTWEWRGLPESHHIARIALHPTNPNVVLVAVLGHLYSPNQERGIYRSADAGQTWQRTLFVNDISGAIDLVLDPNVPNTVYAATWERTRSAWNFNGAGAGSGIWKSTDGGITFNLVSGTGSGFPNGDKTGRIGLAAGLKDGKTVLYASIDNQNPRPEKKDDIEKDKNEINKDKLRVISVADFALLDNDRLESFLRGNDFPEEYNASKVKALMAKGKIAPIALVEYLEDANNNLFETNYIGAEVYRSDDNGASWKKTHDMEMEGIHFTYGYYFSNIRCAPNDADQVYLLGFYIVQSKDGGKTWSSINGDNVHPDHHALWVHPTKPGMLVNGNDGGINVSWDNGASWILCNNPPVGQFYAINVDDADTYNVYGGAQDNGVWVGPSDYEPSTAWHQNGHYPYTELLGGDGMQIEIDTRENILVYTGFQFGNYFRINRRNGQRKNITPKHDLGERPLRFNWQTPIQLSRHHQDVLYLGANKLYRSFDKGDKWEAISGDLTKGGKAGNVPYGTITALHESPLKFGLLYVGSDDGLLHVTRDGGDTWTRITAGLPENLWVSRVQASAHEKGRVFASLNGYRFDDFNAYLYQSDDFGKTWTRIGLGLPAEPINVVREDPANPDLLYVGSDHGLYISFDRGKQFHAVANGLPAVPVHDLAIQAKAKDLIIGTHGRSMFKLPIAQIQAMNAEVLASNLHIFGIKNKRFAKGWGKKTPWREVKDPELPIHFYSNADGSTKYSVKLKNGPTVKEGTIEAKKGLNTLKYNLDVREDALKGYARKLNEDVKDSKKTYEPKASDTGKYYVQKGTYICTIEKDGKTASQEFTIE
jgi:photosystem II stability/assembly factor-like uncharacterized protein